MRVAPRDKAGLSYATDSALIVGERPPASWTGSFGSVDGLPQAIGPPIYVGESKGTNVHLFFFLTGGTEGEPLECRVVWEEGIPGLATEGIATRITCQPLSSPPGFDVVLSGGTPKSPLAWGPLPSGFVKAELRIDDTILWAEVRGGYVFAADLYIDEGVQIAGKAFSRQGKIVYEESIDIRSFLEGDG